MVAVAITRAIEFGYQTVGCASTGNLAHAVAAHAAAAGLRAVVFIPHDLETGKVIGHARLRPAHGEDPRQLRRRQPALHRDRRRVRLGDRQRQPAALLHRGRQDARLRDRRAARLEAAAAHGDPGGGRHDPAQGVEGLPRAHRPRPGRGRRSAHPRGAGRRAATRSCARSRPAREAFQPQKPNTIAKSIAIGNPADGPYAIRVVRESGGHGASATTTRSWPRSSSSRAARASSPSPPAARRSRARSS